MIGAEDGVGSGRQGCAEVVVIGVIGVVGLVMLRPPHLLHVVPNAAGSSVVLFLLPLRRGW